MGKIIIISIVFIAGLIVMVYLIFSRFDWMEMDWNDDREITIAEIFESIDMGKRYIIVDNNTCKEYFSLKDGLPVRLICNHKISPNDNQAN
jgi:hypothetical protein